MVTEPRTTDEIRTELENELTARSDEVSGFAEGSFNRAYVESYAEQIREAEIKALAATLAGSAEYAGRNLTENELTDLGVTTVSPAEINRYMDESQLDQLAANFGVRRNPGTRAQTTVEFTVLDDAVSIEEGTVVSNNLRGDKTQRDFIVDVDGDGEITTDPAPTASPDSGETTVTVNAVAAEVGTSYNLGTDSITKIPVPKPGVQSVTNIEPARGGEDEQSNESLRSEVQRALFETSGGGTRSGLIGYIESNTDETVQVGTNEFTQRDPPFVDVIVDGGNDAELKTLIDEAKPLGLQHNLVRPIAVNVGVNTDLIVDSSIDDGVVENTITGQLNDLSVGDNFYQTSVLESILSTNANIVSGPAVNTAYINVERDQYTYDSTKDIYELTYGPFGIANSEEHVITEDVSVYPLQFTGVDETTVSVSVTQDSTDTALSDTEYSVVDDDGDGVLDAVQIDQTKYAPPQATLTVSYQHSDWAFDTLVGDDGTEYTLNTDFELIDNDGDGAVESIQWLSNATPADNERFFVTYQPRRSFTTDVTIGDTVLFNAAENDISVESYLI